VSTEKETLQRVQGGLFHLRRGLMPFVESRMKAKHGANWLSHASRAAGGPPDASLDVYGLLKTMIDLWPNVFADAFGRHEKNRVRNFTSTALEARNATSHLSIALRDDEALRFLDAMNALLQAVKAPADEIDEIKRLYEEQRRSGLTSNTVPVSAGKSTLSLPIGENTDESVGKSLRPWIEVALPHPDVLANRFKEAEFAANLAAVDAGIASEDYAGPENFFRITFQTEGLKRVLRGVLQRLGGMGGDPVIGLQTAFGGGKTHTMLAAYHLANATDLSLLEGIKPLADAVGVTTWKRAKIAVFVGSSEGPDVSLRLGNGPRVHTPWGYIAWRLAGDAGLQLVAESDAARTNPGSRLLVEVMRLAGPCIILLDELVMFARQLPEERFEAFLSFVQSLTEAAAIVPHALIVGSLPESDAEAGGVKGKEALLRMEKVFGRLQSAWLPASGDETYEIIRRRLFQKLDEDGERDRDATVKAFHDLYKKNPAEFPPEAKETRYQELLRVSYPIHPELFDRLSKDWASLEKFQRTRGVLRFMANVVGVLWQAQTRDPLILPARVPISHERVRVSALYPLDPAFSAVVDKEVDGDMSLPTRMEANPTRRISQARAATRAARAVFLCSAPLVGQPNAGITGQGLRLACAEPGDQLAIFGEALRELTERATYLYEEAGRYWFSTQPTLNRLADDRAKALPAHEIDAAISQVLRDDSVTRGGFHRVFAAPDDPVSVDEVKSLSLVILGPSTPHAGKGAAKSLATEVVTDTLTRCRASQRRFRNTLLFSAADETLLGTAREAMRKAIAWSEIATDRRLQDQLPPTQMRDAAEKAKGNREGAAKAIRLAWNHILFPFKAESTAAGAPFELDHLSIATKDRAAIPVSVYDKAKADGIVKEKLGPDALWLHLKPLWPYDRPHLTIGEIADWFATYVYLPKLRDRVVLDIAIRDGVAKIDPSFGYADRFNEADGTYDGLVWRKLPPELIEPTAVVVLPSVASGQSDVPEQSYVREPPPPSASPTDGPQIENEGRGEATSRESPGKSGQPRRFYGSVEIDMVRPVKSFDQILNAVVMELQRTNGANVKLTLEVQAEAPSGFAQTDIDVVRDNARQLKFKFDSTGFED
jgi:uncharacterized protein